MSKFVRKLVTFPISFISIFLMSLGALLLGYSFVTVVLNNDYVTIDANVVNKDSNDGEEIVLEYVVDEKNYYGNFPFLKPILGKVIPIGYNPDDPTRFHMGDQKFHFALFLWGAFFEMLGVVIITVLHRVNRVGDESKQENKYIDTDKKEDIQLVGEKIDSEV